jgi:peptide deformylase
MRETLGDLQGRHGFGRAIAAPQIGAPIRALYVELDQPWVMINPEIVDVGTDDFLVWDDCFSFIDLMVRVQRAYRIKVRFQDLRGKTHVLELENGAAELLQHEMDHLDGVLAVDRPAGLDPLCLREEWNKHYAHRGRWGKPAPRAEPLPH